MKKNKLTLLPNYVNINLESLSVGLVLPFKIFVLLPENNKIILFLDSNSTLNKSKFDQMKQSSERFYILKSDEITYCNLIRSSISEVNYKKKDSDLTLKCANLLMRSFNLAIDPKSPLSPVEQAGKHIQGVADDVLKLLDLDMSLLSVVKLLQKTLNSKIWNHPLNTSILSVLFSTAVGYTDKMFLREICIGAYIHDVGLLPLELSPQGYEKQYFGEELTLYKKHPRSGIELIDSLGLEISDIARLIIFQHEEYFGGDGFPLGIRGPDIFEPAQIVSIADKVDQTIRLDQKNPFPAEQALLKIFDENSSLGENVRYNPILLKHLIDSING